jgi:stage 0 sporulation regulatory protein
MVKELERLEKQIQQLKKELILKVEENGLNSPVTLYSSQQLDKLIVIYQKCVRPTYLK